MQLKLNKEVKIKAWHNESLIANDDWTVYSEDQGDVIYIYVKDPMGTNQVKLKIEKTVEINEGSSES